MTSKLKGLFDKKGSIVSQMQDVYRDVNKRADAKATEEERTKFRAWDAELLEIDAQVEDEERSMRLNAQEVAKKATEQSSDDNKSEKKFNDAATAIERREVLAKSNKRGYDALTADERVIADTEVRDMKVFDKILRGFDLSKEEQVVANKYKEKRAGVQSTTVAAGGYTIPEGFAGRIVEYMTFISSLLNYVSILRTSTGNTIPYPINDDTANTGELVSEAQDLSSATAALVFSVYNLNAYKFSSKMIKMSAELIQDSGVNIVDYLAKKLAVRLARITNTHYTNGTGSNQPQGYMTAAARGRVTASTSTFTLVELQSFQDSIDPAYGEAPGVAWAMHQNLLSEIKQLAMATANFGSVWTPSFRDGAPSTILGKPYFLNQAMSSTSATGDKIIAYGDFSKFIVRIVNDINIKRLDERYAEFDQVAWFGLMRADSFLENTEAVKYLDIS